MRRRELYLAALSVLGLLFLQSPSSEGSTLRLPAMIVTDFPPGVVEDEEPFAPSGPYYAIPLEQYDPKAEVAVDGISDHSIPLNWWYTYDETASGPEFHGINPTHEDGSQRIRYTYPDDGDVGHVVSQFRSVFDASSYEALVLVARADRPVDAEITLSFHDSNLPSAEPDEPFGASSAVFPVKIPVVTEAQAFVFLLSHFNVHPWIVRNVAGASSAVDWSRIFEFKIAPQEQSAIEILRVAFAKEMPRAVLPEEPTTAGGPPVINLYYFQHPAHVMQGAADLGAVYALPLRGIPELRTGYVAEDPDGGQLTWDVTTSNPSIGAGFQDEILHIWGTDPGWSGQGNVTLTVTNENALTDSVAIPVTVFRDDKTLINAEGKRDYLVPWSPQLDINRILSVEEHMRTYKKDEGQLDRSIHWSRWKRMEYRQDVDFITL